MTPYDLRDLNALCKADVPDEAVPPYRRRFDQTPLETFHYGDAEELATMDDADRLRVTDVTTWLLALFLGAGALLVGAIVARLLLWLRGG